MSFMQPEIVFGDWIEVDGDNGTEFLPADLVTLPDYDAFERPDDLPEDAEFPDQDESWLEAARAACEDYIESRKVYTIAVRQGWGARMSAPGYMDCTEWCVFATEGEAEDYLKEYYGDDETEDDESEESGDDGPDDDSITSTDHCRWYQYGKLVLDIPIEADHVKELRDYMDRAQFWVDAYFISDHGNAHRIDLSEGSK